MDQDLFLILIGAGFSLGLGVITFFLQLVISQIAEHWRLEADLSEQQMRERLIYSFFGIKISQESVVRIRNALIIGTF